jgi:hypothetical protein
MGKDTISILDGPTFLMTDLVTLEGIPGRWGRAYAAGTRMEEALA